MRKKLASRKFWVAAVSIAAGVLGALGAEDSLVQMVSAVGLVLVPAVVYILTEGKLDAAALRAVDLDALGTAVSEYLAGKTAAADGGGQSSGTAGE